MLGVGVSLPQVRLMILHWWPQWRKVLWMLLLLCLQERALRQLRWRRLRAALV
jgi:hypothetical protein